MLPSLSKLALCDVGTKRDASEFTFPKFDTVLKEIESQETPNAKSYYFNHTKSAEEWNNLLLEHNYFAVKIGGKGNIPTTFDASTGQKGDKEYGYVRSQDARQELIDHLKKDVESGAKLVNAILEEDFVTKMADLIKASTPEGKTPCIVFDGDLFECEVNKVSPFCALIAAIAHQHEIDVFSFRNGLNNFNSVYSFISDSPYREAQDKTWNSVSIGAAHYEGMSTIVREARGSILSRFHLLCVTEKPSAATKLVAPGRFIYIGTAMFDQQPLKFDAAKKEFDANPHLEAGGFETTGFLRPIRRVLRTNVHKTIEVDGDRVDTTIGGLVFVQSTGMFELDQLAKEFNRTFEAGKIVSGILSHMSGSFQNWFE